jgi:hypothetical protein
MEVIDYLYTQRAFIPSESFPNVIRTFDGLDGALSESYAAMMGESFTRDRTAMTKALANADKTHPTHGIGSIAYALSYRETKEVKKEIRQWQAGQQLTTGKEEYKDIGCFSIRGAAFLCFTILRNSIRPAPKCNT